MRFFGKFYKISIAFYAVFLLYLMFFGFGRSPYPINIVRLVPMFSTLGFVKETILWNHFYQCLWEYSDVYAFWLFRDCFPKAE